MLKVSFQTGCFQVVSLAALASTEGSEAARKDWLEYSDNDTGIFYLKTVFSRNFE